MVLCVYCFFQCYRLEYQCGVWYENFGYMGGYVFFLFLVYVVFIFLIFCFEDIVLDLGSFFGFYFVFKVLLMVGVCVNQSFECEVKVKEIF